MTSPVRLLLAVLFLALTPVLSEAQQVGGTHPVSVASEQEFASAIRGATDARTIALRPGTYRELVLENLPASAVITLVAAEPANPPVVNRLMIAGSKNIVVDGLRFQPSGEEAMGAFLVDIRRAENISILRSRFEALPFQGTKRARAISALTVNRLQIADNRIIGLERGLFLTDTKDASLLHNLFEGLTGDGVNITSADGLVLAGNRFSAFRVDAGQSADFVQFWTRRAAEPSRNISILSNVMLQDTPEPIKGIFMGNEGNTPVGNVIVEGNIIISGSPHGITIRNASDVTVERNIVLDARDSSFNNSIRLHRVTAGTVADNLSMRLGITFGTGIVTRRNTTYSRVGDNTRRVMVERVTSGLQQTGAPTPVSAGLSITAVHRSAGPRPR